MVKRWNKKRRLEALREFPLLAGCTEAQIARIELLGTVSRVRAGAPLMREGGWEGECFLVFEGEATVSIGDRAIDVVGPGSVVGEMALLDKTGRTATVIADTPMRVFMLTRAELRALIDLVPTAGAELRQLVARRRAADEERKSD